MPQTPQSMWTRLQRIQHLSVYWECLGKSAATRGHVTSNLLHIAGEVLAGHEEGKEDADVAALLS
jgi:hypothetical protein